MMAGAQFRGMTLIELLLATSVASLVLVGAVSVYLVVRTSLNRQHDNRQAVAHAAIDQLRRDLAACAQAPLTNALPFLLESRGSGEGSPALSQLALAIGGFPSPEADFSRLEVTRVSYGVVPAGGDNSAGNLVRETVTLWGPEAMAPAVSNVVMEEVAGFEVAVFEGAGWTNSWKSSVRTLFPRAARIKLGWRAGATTETATVDIFIPAGNPVAVPSPPRGAGTGPAAKRPGALTGNAAPWPGL